MNIFVMSCLLANTHLTISWWKMTGKRVFTEKLQARRSGNHVFFNGNHDNLRMVYSINLLMFDIHQCLYQIIVCIGFTEAFRKTAFPLIYSTNSNFSMK